jgi:hypothetical protein
VRIFSTRTLSFALGASRRQGCVSKARHSRCLCIKRISWIVVDDSGYVPAAQTEFKDIQAAHNPKKPLDQMSEPQQNGALVEVCKVIKSALTPATSG